MAEPFAEGSLRLRTSELRRIQWLCARLLASRGVTRNWRLHRLPRRTLALVALAAIASPLRAAEIDSVTSRNAPLRDSSKPLDARIHDALRTAVERANERGSDCDPQDLTRQLRRALSVPFIGHAIAEDLNDADDLDTRRVAFRDSIYRDLGVFDAISVHLKDLSAVIRLGDDLVGVDKIGHFFVQGWTYFEIAYLKGDGIEAAMDWGERAERTYFGLYTTGIYSYADLSANFEGMRFWLRLLGPEPDPLDRGWRFNRPAVTCGKRFWTREPYWRIRRKPRLSRYVSGAWDEGVNCSRYRNPEIEALVADRIAEREAADAASYACPIRPDACVEARERYGPYADRLLHPRCAAAERPPRPWWKFW